MAMCCLFNAHAALFDDHEIMKELWSLVGMQAGSFMSYSAGV
jgi:hypothetical protein